MLALAPFWFCFGFVCVCFGLRGKIRIVSERGMCTLVPALALSVVRVSTLSLCAAITEVVSFSVFVFLFSMM